MTSGKDRREQASPNLPKPDPVSLPENADFRYDEQEAPDPGPEGDVDEKKKSRE